MDFVCHYCHSSSGGDTLRILTLGPKRLGLPGGNRSPSNRIKFPGGTSQKSTSCGAASPLFPAPSCTAIYKGWGVVWKEQLQISLVRLSFFATLASRCA